MSKLYHELSSLYEAMYQTFINYEEEFAFYHSILLSHQCQSVLEVGCGTGHLAERFLHIGMSYLGMDMSEDMIDIARKNTSSDQFMVGDMRHFGMDQKTDSAIITGRTLSYLVTNNDVMASFRSIHRNLNEAGILVFDVIDASRFIPSIGIEKEVMHYADFNSSHYRRKSIWKPNYENGFCFDWAATYQVEENDHWTDVGHDFSTIRTFTADEIRLMLRMSGYVIVEVRDRASYAFDTLVFIARKA